MKRKFLSQSGSWPSGNPRIYFRVPGKRGSPLPDAHPESAEFIAAYDAALKSETAARVRRLKIGENTMTILDRAARRARWRATQKGVPYDITIGHLIALLNQQRFRCALTGVQFSTSAKAGSRAANAPSIDRIDPAAGYTAGNVRLTTTIANCARGDFSDADFYAMCKGAYRLSAQKLQVSDNLEL